MTTILWFVIVHYIWRPFLPLAQLLVVFYPGVLVFWLVMHTRIEHWRKVGKRAFWIASLGWPATAVPLIYFREEVFSAQWQPREGIVSLGIVTLVVSAILARKAGTKIPLRTLIGLPELEPQKNRQPLIHDGIYSRTRNPVYLAHWLIIFSAAAISGFAANWVLFAVDCIVLPMMIRAEERELLNRYGSEFADYMRRVPRFFPKWTW